MTPDAIRSALKRWHEAMHECDTRMDQLADIAGQIVESPLGDAVYHVMGEYTKAVADLIDWDESALSDWWLSHQFGERPMNIGLPGEEMQTLSDIDQLADFIIADLARIAQ